MASRLTPRSRRWLQWASGLLLIAAGGAQPLAMAAAAPQIPAGEARIWFYEYATRVRENSFAGALIPTVVANGTYVGPVPPGTLFYRDVALGISTSRSQTASALNMDRRTSTSPRASRPLLESSSSVGAIIYPGSTRRASAPCSSPRTSCASRVRVLDTRRRAADPRSQGRVLPCGFDHGSRYQAPARALSGRTDCDLRQHLGRGQG